MVNQCYPDRMTRPLPVKFGTIKLTKLKLDRSSGLAVEAERNSGHTSQPQKCCATPRCTRTRTLKPARWLLGRELCSVPCTRRFWVLMSVMWLFLGVFKYMRVEQVSGIALSGKFTNLCRTFWRPSGHHTSPPRIVVIHFQAGC